MVRWIKKGEGKCEYDFSVMEKYVDTALKSGLKPSVVCLYVWEGYCGAAGSNIRGAGGGLGVGGGKENAMNLLVSALDPNSGVVTQMEGPKYTDQGIVEFWKPVVEGVKTRLRERGLEKAIMVGYSGDVWPKMEVVEAWKTLLPETKWVAVSHFPHLKVHDVPVGLNVVKYPRGYEQRVDPAIKRFYGWQLDHLAVNFYQVGMDNLFPFARGRLMGEKSLEGGERGFGGQGADTWEPFDYWPELHMSTTWFGPGPNGAISTVRFEMMREGLQECEARIFIEKALTDKDLRAKLGEARAAQYQGVLDERLRYQLWAHDGFVTDQGQILTIGVGYPWYAGSGWQERSRKLYEAAADVAGALGRK
jgi:hypothetical protein